MLAEQGIISLDVTHAGTRASPHLWLMETSLDTCDKNVSLCFGTKRHISGHMFSSTLIKMYVRTLNNFNANVIMYFILINKYLHVIKMRALSFVSERHIIEHGLIR